MLAVTPGFTGRNKHGGCESAPDGHRCFEDGRDPQWREGPPCRTDPRLEKKVACQRSDDSVDVPRFETSIGNGTESPFHCDAARIMTFENPGLTSVVDADDRDVVERVLAHCREESPRCS
jgi:hypothetical protein